MRWPLAISEATLTDCHPAFLICHHEVAQRPRDLFSLPWHCCHTLREQIPRCAPNDKHANKGLSGLHLELVIPVSTPQPGSGARDDKIRVMFCS